MNMNFSRQQLECFYNNKKWSNVTLVSEDKEHYYGHTDILGCRWLWFQLMKNGQSASSSKEEENFIQIETTGKNLCQILQWIYLDSVDIGCWNYADLRTLEDACQQFGLPELKEKVLSELSKDKLELGKLRRIFEFGCRKNDEELCERVAEFAEQQLETVHKSGEFKTFQTELVVKIVQKTNTANYPKLFRALAVWSDGQTQEDVETAVKHVAWDSVPTEFISAVVSRLKPLRWLAILEKVNWNSTESPSQIETNENAPDEIPAAFRVQPIVALRSGNLLRLDNVEKLELMANRTVGDVWKILSTADDFIPVRGSNLTVHLRQPIWFNTMSWKADRRVKKVIIVNTDKISTAIGTRGTNRIVFEAQNIVRFKFRSDASFKINGVACYLT